MQNVLGLPGQLLRAPAIGRKSTTRDNGGLIQMIADVLTKTEVGVLRRIGWALKPKAVDTFYAYTNPEVHGR